MADALLEDLSGGVDDMMVDEDGYRVPRQKTMKQLLETKEGEDAALQRYKSNLLGAAAVADGGGTSSDPRRVVIKQLTIIINGDHPPFIFDMTDEALVSAGINITLKEGCEYKTQLTFVVQNEIVSGLKYRNSVSRGMIPLLKVDEMLGSYGPDPSRENTIVFPRREWDEAPSGVTARGTYNAKTSFVDDDRTEHLAFKYRLTIAKDWQ